LLAELLVVLAQLLTSGTGLVSLHESLLDFGGVLVDRLAAAASLAGLLGDGAETVAESGSGIADPGNEA